MTAHGTDRPMTSDWGGRWLGLLTTIKPGSQKGGSGPCETKNLTTSHPNMDNRRMRLVANGGPRLINTPLFLPSILVKYVNYIAVRITPWWSELPGFRTKRLFLGGKQIE